MENQEKLEQLKNLKERLKSAKTPEQKKVIRRRIVQLDEDQMIAKTLGIKSDMTGGIETHKYSDGAIISGKEHIKKSSYDEGGNIIGNGSYTYHAFFKNKKIEVKADTQYEAQKKAAEYFKTKKSWEISILLVKKGDEDVSIFNTGAMYDKGGKVKDIEFKHSNLIFYGFKRDLNGNSIVKIGFPNHVAFTIQTNADLPFTHSNRTSNISELNQEKINKIEKEIVKYITIYGSTNQKGKLKIYK